jgi:large subunit ribosomal protein L23
MNVHDVIRRPVITEKATVMKETDNTLCFEVHPWATSVDVRRAVETIFKVEVSDVRMITVRSKPRRLGRYAGTKPGWKKAYVRLAPGSRMIEYFEGV